MILVMKGKLKGSTAQCIVFLINALFSETADWQIEYVRQLCIGNPRLQYLLGKQKMEATYTQTLDLTAFHRSFSGSDIQFFREHIMKIMIEQVCEECGNFISTCTFLFLLQVQIKCVY